MDRSTILRATVGGLGLALAGLSVAATATAGGRPLSTDLSGANEVPGPGDPDGTGTAELTVNLGRNEICYELHRREHRARRRWPTSTLRRRAFAGPVVVNFDPPVTRVIRGLHQRCRTGSGEEHPQAPRAVLRERPQRRVDWRALSAASCSKRLSAGADDGRRDGRPSSPALDEAACSDRLAADDGARHRRDDRIDRRHRHPDDRRVLVDPDRADVRPRQSGLVGDRADEVGRSDPRSPPEAELHETGRTLVPAAHRFGVTLGGVGRPVASGSPAPRPSPRSPRGRA